MRMCTERSISVRDYAGTGAQNRPFFNAKQDTLVILECSIPNNDSIFINRRLKRHGYFQSSPIFVNTKEQNERTDLKPYLCCKLLGIRDISIYSRTFHSICYQSGIKQAFNRCLLTIAKILRLITVIKINSKTATVAWINGRQCGEMEITLDLGPDNPGFYPGLTSTSWITLNMILILWGSGSLFVKWEQY